MAEKVGVLIPEEKLNERIQEMAEQINKDYQGEEVHLIGVLRGACFFLCELAKRLTVPVTLDFMLVSSYGLGTISDGNIKIKKDLDDSIEGKHVILIEDIIDTGHTLSRLGPLLKERGAKTLKICVLLDKPDRREVEVSVDYVGFQIPDKLVVGCGLDYAQKYRNLPYIGEVEL